jgi:bisanhydrobacterioruberin hydratase
MNKMKTNTKTFYISIFIAILFHISGLIGMSTEARSWFISMTPLTLLLMSGLIIWNENKITKAFILFFCFCAIVGFLSELIGTNTGLLFGMYSYGNAFGYKILGTPLLISILWFGTVYSVGQIVLAIYISLSKNSERSIATNFLLINIAAALTTFFDYILEPAAIALGYWEWHPEGEIPVFNYICWYFISGFLYAPFFIDRTLSSDVNYFAAFLIFIQTIFFILVV